MALFVAFWLVLQDFSPGTGLPTGPPRVAVGLGLSPNQKDARPLSPDTRRQAPGRVVCGTSRGPYFFSHLYSSCTPASVLPRAISSRTRSSFFFTSRARRATS
ncbi:MAG: hypothetical protein PWP08_322 [Methanofollis sp.]|nr:hypothetical protein [Methanofollis sp.]